MRVRRTPDRAPGPRPSRIATVAAGVFVLAFALWAGLFALRQQQIGDAFDIARWELSAVANKWLFALGRPLRSDPDEEEALSRYFALADRGGEEARRYENVVEAAIEGRIDAVLREQRVRGAVSLPGPLAVWPPVDLELARAPRVLIVSPRSRIERLRTELLRPDLTLEDAIAVETRVEAGDGSLSALVRPAGGFALYPAVVSNRGSYAGTVDTAAHEWTHHYLAFYPLGFGVPAGDRLTINETVADIVAAELADLVLERFGAPTVRDHAAADDGSSTPAPTPAVDRDRVLRELRMEVDELLGQGRVEQAERRMEEVRLELEQAGVRIRRLNQAYFAWIGTYAARADSIDRLGPQLRELRERTGSLARFLAAVRGARSRADVERLLKAAGGG